MSLRVDMHGHTGIVGITRSGKTKLGTYLFQKTGGLFVDIKNMNEVQCSVTITKKNSPKSLENALKMHHKVRYVPDADPEKAKKEARYLVRKLLSLNLSKHVWVDEIQNYGSSRQNAFDPLATQGLGAGIHLNWITQRPAKASKTITSQTDTLILFDMSSFEAKYFKEYELPYDEIKSKLESQPKYYFVVYTRGKPISEPYKLALKQS